ncbi:hypothetical protein [Halohasta litorea]|uniref:Uncharacterized protein n=1 Tax=Halohasta litorea TaxID=869891 RepID=A0ABD6D8P3_9EURY|nr:hypothetical protein [Halohasta litorea]
MPSRRRVLAGLAAGPAALAGCLGDDDLIARCSSRGRGSGSQHLRGVSPIRGATQVALGIVVSSEATESDSYRFIEIRDRDDELVGSIPLDDNRDMSRLDSDQFSISGAQNGEVYAFPLDRPPVHGAYTVSLINSSEASVATARLRFNCYSQDGSLP